MTAQMPRRHTKIACDENRFMDLWDAGYSREQIAEMTDADPGRVNYVLGYMRPGLDDQRTGPRAVAKASRDLLAALRRHHPDRVGERAHGL